MEIEQKDIRGGQLLNLLHKRCHCGVPELQSCIQRYYHNYFCTCDIWDNWTAINSNSFCVSHGNLCASIFVTVTLQCILFHMSPNGGVLSIYFLSVDWKKRIGYFGTGTRSCSTSWHLGWFMGFFKISTVNFSLEGQHLLQCFFKSVLFTLTPASFSYLISIFDCLL